MLQSPFLGLKFQQKENLDGKTFNNHNLMPGLRATL